MKRSKIYLILDTNITQSIYKEINKHLDFNNVIRYINENNRNKVIQQTLPIVDKLHYFTERLIKL